jgi:hypothetical protein
MQYCSATLLNRLTGYLLLQFAMHHTPIPGVLAWTPAPTQFFFLPS